MKVILKSEEVKTALKQWAEVYLKEIVKEANLDLDDIRLASSHDLKEIYSFVVVFNQKPKERK